ncbi:nuclear pore complex protein NUP214-like isoform X2 [Triticum dicoccoides]|uniref:nuclear pore complex protein NUP214-like isoform X2 n=1 Tax=Triticum dicoccoides TaxID=85692 RepID=UPI0018902A59|nr:nuclear pore complex protein NUP214-like isoform X2 [Triticum dicoccoides]
MAAPRELDLSDEVEGQRDGTADFVFCLVGDPIPVLPPASAPLPLFDLQSPPARPLAVSDGHAAVFLAHPDGFIAARTNALIEASKEAREKGKASTRCAQDCCVIDVPLPGVTLLALSGDQSVLAACTGSEIQFFSATSLLTDKDIKPSSSCSMGRFGTVKDFKWLDNAYIVLSNGGLLSHGSLGQGLKDIMENVDAVDCSKDGNHIAVARKNSLRILSPDLMETCCMALLFQLWPDSDSEGTDIKVDSIGWVRDDSIVVGCVRLNEESNEEGYLVQVIRSGGDTFFESSSKPVVFSYDVFRGIMNDILPSGVGPNLLLGYLHRWDLLVVTNKKSTDDHISLLKWPSRTDEERTVVYLKMVEDNYSPRIDLQENGDGNVLLGFGVENVSLFEKITVLVGPEQKEVAPQHLLLCLASEGKLMIYYLARISDPSDLPQKSLSTIENTNVNKQISPATASDKHLTASVISTSHDGKSLLAGHGTMATHDGSKAKKEKDPGESCRRLFSAVCEKLRDEREKYKAKPEKYKDELTTDSEDWTLISIIEKRLNAPTDCAEPPAEYYRELTEELQTVTKRIIARKHAFERDDLVKTLRRLIREISQIDSADSFVDTKSKTEAVQACSWLDNRLKEQGSISIYEVPPSLTCKDIQNWIDKLKQVKEPKRIDRWQEFSSAYDQPEPHKKWS